MHLMIPFRDRYPRPDVRNAKSPKRVMTDWRVQSGHAGADDDPGTQLPAAVSGQLSGG
jgi:hypothetical protein